MIVKMTLIAHNLYHLTFLNSLYLLTHLISIVSVNYFLSQIWKLRKKLFIIYLFLFFYIMPSNAQGSLPTLVLFCFATPSTALG